MLPSQSFTEKFVEDTLLSISKNFGCKEIRTPVFEHTELFQRGVGDTTDVVQKEMYTFEDKGSRSITLRPEGTAGVVRAALEHGLTNEALPLKLSYLTSCYRYEKPQAGRLREFHQFGVECLGAADPIADARLILLAQSIFDFFEIDGITLEINSIGCPECRNDYYTALRNYFSQRKEELCETCQGRLEKNPMRILDCKSPVCQSIAADAPLITDYLCDECKEHFEKLKNYLNAENIAFKVNPRIVRGLDYYTKTVFEFKSAEIGAQGTVLGGGRYDGLVEELGGKPTPALGFAMGLERFMLLCAAQGKKFPPEQTPDIYFCNIGDKALECALSLSAELASDGYGAEIDLMRKSLKAQMKYAGKIGAKFTAVIGDEEIEKNEVAVKNMLSGESFKASISGFSEDFENIILQSVMSDTADTAFRHFNGGEKI